MTNQEAKELVSSLKDKVLTKDEVASLKLAVAIMQASCFNIGSEINQGNLNE